MSKFNTKIAGAIAGCLLTLLALGLVLYHATPHCSFSSPHSESNVCAEELVEICPGAFKSISSVVRGGNVYTSSMMCPWRKPTYMIGIFSLSLTQILMILFAFQLAGKALKIPMTVLASIILPMLLVACALMVKDITDGYDYSRENPGAYKFLQQSYLINLGLVFASVIVVGWAVRTGFMLSDAIGKKQYNEIHELQSPKSVDENVENQQEQIEIAV